MQGPIAESPPCQGLRTWSDFGLPVLQIVGYTSAEMDSYRTPGVGVSPGGESAR